MSINLNLRKNRKWLIAAAVAIILLGLLINLWQSGRPPQETDRIYTYTFIHGVAVGGMTGEEADAALMERFQTGLDTRVVRYILNGEVVAELTFADFGARFDFSAPVDDALAFSHGRGIFSRISRGLGRDYEIDSPPLFVFSAQRMEDNMQRLSRELDSPAGNASFAENAEGEIIVIEESAGFGVDIETAALETRDILQSLQSGEIELRAVNTRPQYTTAHFNFTATEMGAFHTQCVTDDDARRRNIDRAAARIHNFVLYTGEVFSAAAVMEANNPEIGYETAIVLVQGEPAEDIGGGVCQVVTTLYNAVLRAELEIIQRHNHSARVSYVDLGFDATVAGDYYDLKFRNSTAHPILITAHVENDRLHVRILGYETRDAARTIRFEARQGELLQPEPYREILDPAMPRGNRMVTQPSQMGYHVELFKYVYENGIPVAQEKINTSVYRPLQGTIAIGVG